MFYSLPQHSWLPRYPKHQPLCASLKAAARLGMECPLLQRKGRCILQIGWVLRCSSNCLPRCSMFIYVHLVRCGCHCPTIQRSTINPCSSAHPHKTNQVRIHPHTPQAKHIKGSPMKSHLCKQQHPCTSESIKAISLRRPMESVSDATWQCSFLRRRRLRSFP